MYALVAFILAAFVAFQELEINICANNICSHFV
jgi:hypothetical protein